MALGRQIGLARPDLENLGTGTLLTDIGKMKIPSELLNKPGRLSDAEFEIVRKHVHHGVAILQESNGVPAPVIEVVATHHERYDGTGYPRGVKGGASLDGLLPPSTAMTP